jgi:hypothetical protein
LLSIPLTRQERCRAAYAGVPKPGRQCGKVPWLLRFTSAGHPSPLRIAHDRQGIEYLKDHDPRHGPALGLFEKADYPTCFCPVAERDFFLLFTDGIYEAESPAGEEYGLDRLQRAQFVPVPNRLQTTSWIQC